MLRLVLSPDTAELATVRAAIRDWAGERDIADWPLTLIATELIANAIAVTPATASVELCVIDAHDAVEVRVADPGPGFGDTIDLDALALPPPETPGGRGLYLVQQLSSGLRTQRLGGRTVVSAIQPRPGASSPDRG
jgi:anti-sigma regulatory factor (Ser/Thr protein kinase)